MSEQNTAAAERSAHVTRGDANNTADTCAVCHSPWKKGGASHAARFAPFRQVCSAECAALPPFASPVPSNLYREGFQACQALAARRYDDAARYVRLRARSEADHNVAATYEQAAAMIRAMPLPEAR